MAYRNGTYVTFHTEGSTTPIESDMNYRLLQAWHKNENAELWFVNSHEKTAAVRDSSTKLTWMNWLAEKLRSSRNMLIVITKSTRQNNDWVPFEIEYAIDTCDIPIIAAYPDCEWILQPDKKEHLWPDALLKRIAAQAARVIQVPFKQEPIRDAMRQFDIRNRPKGALCCYAEDVYRGWGIM